MWQATSMRAGIEVEVGCSHKVFVTQNKLFEAQVAIDVQSLDFMFPSAGS
jgi:hypothetical protein